MHLSTKIKALLPAIAVVASSCVNDDFEENVSLISAGSELPAFEVSLNDGKSFDTSELNGRATVIILFNTGCEDCRAELPVVQRVYESSGADATFIAISREESAESVASYWTEHSITIPYSAQTDRKIYNLFANSGIP